MRAKLLLTFAAAILAVLATFAGIQALSHRKGNSDSALAAQPLRGQLVEQGAQAIIPLGGKIYPYVVTPGELEPPIGVPVVNTKAVGVSHAELMVRSKISHSQKAYPWSAGLSPEAVSQRSK